MPKIREYEAQVSSQFESRERAATASDFNTGAGLAVIGEGLDSVVEVVQKRAEQDENTRIHVELTKARAEWTDYLREAATAAPAGDATFADSFVERLDGYLSQTGENLAKTRNGKRLFATAAANLRADLLDRAKVYQAESAGEKAKVDHKTALDKSREALLRDPTQFDSALRGMEAMINDPGGTYSNLPGAAREQLRLEARQSLALSAVQGVIHMNPELAKRQLESGRWGEYLDADNAHALMKEAEVGINARRTEADRKRALADRAEKDAQDAALDKFLARIVSPEANGGSPLDQEILTDRVLSPSQKQAMIDYKTRRAFELKSYLELRTNPKEVRQLRDSVYATLDDPAKLATSMDSIMGSYREGKISTGEMTSLREDVYALRNPELRNFQIDVQRVRSRVYRAFAGSVVGQIQPDAAEHAAQRFDVDLDRKIKEKRKAGEDPRSLLNPKSRDYVLSPEILQTYFKLPQEAMADVAAAERAKDDLPPGFKPNPPELPSYRKFDSLKSGDEFIDPKGNVRRKP